MNDRSSTSRQQNEAENVNHAKNGNTPATQGSAYKLPALLQNSLKRLSLTLEDADDEASTHRSKIQYKSIAVFVRLVVSFVIRYSIPVFFFLASYNFYRALYHTFL